MREIKFRAWDNVAEKMLIVENIDFRQGYISLNEGDNSMTDTFEMFELMQYTGLKDVNGKEIYEGDILCLSITEELINSSFSNSSLGKEVIKKKATKVILVFKNDKEQLGIFFDLYFEIDGVLKIYANDNGHRFPKYVIIKGAEIIGNIYEDNEFIEKKYSC